MTHDFVTDAMLSKDVYEVYNSGKGAVGGWQRIAIGGVNPGYMVESGANFAGQLYRSTEGAYKIAIRGTANPTGDGDWQANKSIAGGSWAAEFSKGIDFVYRAIWQVAYLEKTNFANAAAMISITGHSQGGTESEVYAKMFNLRGTNIDGPGAAAIVSSADYRYEWERLRRKVPDYVFDRPLKDFVARQYTLFIGGVKDHIPGAVQEKSYLWLLIASSPLGQIAVAHKIESIIATEKLRASYPVLRTIVDTGSDPSALAVALSEPWANYLAGGGVQASADTVADLIQSFLSGQGGAQITVRQVDGSLLIESSTGDSFILKPDGSGSSVSTVGITTTEQIYARGALPLASLQVQRDDDGNILAQVTQDGQRAIVAIGPDGSLIAKVTQIIGSNGEVVRTEYQYPERSLGTDYFVGPNGQIISSAGELMNGPGGPRPTIVVDEWGREHLWNGSHPENAGYGWVNDSWLTREDTAYRGTEESGMFDADVSQALAQLIQSISGFPQAQQDDPRRRVPLEAPQELQPPPPALRPERRRGGLWDVGP